MKDRKYYLVDIRCVEESDGKLIVAESGNQVPFDIKRIFCVKDVGEGQERGTHATKKTKLILVPLSGACDVEVDTGTHKEVFHMDTPAKGLYIDEMIWRTMRNFTPDCVMLAMADRVFDAKNETYNDYDEFIAAVKSEDDNG